MKHTYLLSAYYIRSCITNRGNRRGEGGGGWIDTSYPTRVLRSRNSRNNSSSAAIRGSQSNCNIFWCLQPVVSFVLFRFHPASSTRALPRPCFGHHIWYISTNKKGRVDRHTMAFSIAMLCVGGPQNARRDGDARRDRDASP